ncbi:hypothetical protein ACSFB8_12450 [Enterococcus faecalis]
MENLKKLPLISFSKMFSMFLLGMVFFTSLFLAMGIKVNADQLEKTNNNLLSTAAESQALIDSDGNPISNANGYYIRAVVDGVPDKVYYFENHRKPLSTYDWLYLTPTKEKACKYTIDDPAPTENVQYYFKNVDDNKYLTGHPWDFFHRKGGVYESKKEEADKWYFKPTRIGGKTGYELYMSLDVFRVYFDPDTSSVIANGNIGHPFYFFFEKA